MSGPYDIRVRGYLDDDLDACRQLWVDLTQRHRDIFDSPGIGGDDPGRKFDEHLARVGPERIWLAEAGGVVVGMVALQDTDGQLELEPIVVAEAWRGRGVGRLLAGHVIEAAKAAGARMLAVKPVGRNDRAIEFFHGLGFDVIGQYELLLDLRDPGEQRWQPGPSVAGLPFRR